MSRMPCRRHEGGLVGCRGLTFSQLGNWCNPNPNRGVTPIAQLGESKTRSEERILSSWPTHQFIPKNTNYLKTRIDKLSDPECTDQSNTSPNLHADMMSNENKFPINSLGDECVYWEFIFVRHYVRMWLGIRGNYLKNPPIHTSHSPPRPHLHRPPHPVIATLFPPVSCTPSQTCRMPGNFGAGYVSSLTTIPARAGGCVRRRCRLRGCDSHAHTYLVSGGDVGGAPRGAPVRPSTRGRRRPRRSCCLACSSELPPHHRLSTGTVFFRFFYPLRVVVRCRAPSRVLVR